VIFFSHTIDGFTKQLRDMESIYHCLGILQQLPTGLVIGRPHVHTITKHALTLLRREQFQASRGRFLVAARFHRQHLGILRITQIGHDGHVQLVAFLQADLVHADVRDDALRIDHQRLTIGQLVLHDETHRLCRDAQSPRHLGFGGADEHLQHLFLEAIGVTGVFAFERRQEILAMMAFGAAMEHGLIAEKAGLSENIEIADDAHFADVEIGFQACRLDRLAAWTAARFGQEPRNFHAMSIGEAMIPRDGNTFGQIDFDGEVGHGRPWQR
jgi:hypothetical protein